MRVQGELDAGLGMPERYSTASAGNRDKGQTSSIQPGNRTLDPITLKNFLLRECTVHLIPSVTPMPGAQIVSHL